MPVMTILELPYPPSVNHYYQHGKGRMWIGAKGKAYREQVWAILKQKKIKPFEGKLCLDIYVYPPDKRKRDADNTQKCLFDALQHGGLYMDDYQVAKFCVTRLEPVKGGKIMIYAGSFLQCREWG